MDNSQSKIASSSSHSDWHSVLQQSMGPITLTIAEISKVDVVITIGRLMLVPALAVVAITVLCATPAIRAWEKYYPEKKSDVTDALSSNNSDDKSNIETGDLKLEANMTKEIDASITSPTENVAEAHSPSRRRLK